MKCELCGEEMEWKYNKYWCNRCYREVYVVYCYPDRLKRFHVDWLEEMK